LLGSIQNCFGANFIHPPIDSILLDALFENLHGELKRNIGEARKIRWSKFDSDQYEKVIETIKKAIDNEPIWTIERYWRGYQ